MPFRRRFMRRRRFLRRRPRFIRKNFTRKVTRVIRKMAETKYYTQSIAVDQFSTPRTTGSFADGLDQGITSSTRIGTKIQAKMWRYRLHVNFITGSAIGTSADGSLRVIVAHPRKGQNETSVLTALSSVTFNELVNNEAVYVLSDRTIPLASITAGTGAGRNEMTIQFNRRTFETINYREGATTVERGPVFMIWSNLGAGLNQSFIRVEGEVRMSYKDI